MIKQALALGRRDALRKFALGPPTQVDQFIAGVENGKDVLPMSASQEPEPLSALDGSIPPQGLPTFGTGSTVAPELASAPGMPGA
jgi:hypothetical protein